MNFPALICALCPMLLCATTAEAKYEKLEPVTDQTVEDKAGYDSATELDFKSIQLNNSVDALEIVIETWTAWGEIPDPTDAKVIIKVANAGMGKFFPQCYQALIDEEGAVSPTTYSLEGTDVDKGKKKRWTANVEALKARLDGTTITLTIQWDDLPSGEIQLQACAMHKMEKTDPDTGEVTKKFYYGSSNPVPSDFVPNYGKAIVVSRPDA